jgi:predicted nucleic acid-binding Zn ribbon protein
MADEDFQNKFKTGTEVLQKLFEGGNSPLSQQFIRWKMWSKWDQVVGPTLAKQTEPVGLQRSTLWIWVPHSTILHQMTFLKDNILLAVQKAYPQLKVTEVRFTLDRKQTPQGQDPRDKAQAFIKKMGEK